MATIISIPARMFPEDIARATAKALNGKLGRDADATVAVHGHGLTDADIQRALHVAVEKLGAATSYEIVSQRHAWRVDGDAFEPITYLKIRAS